MKPQIVRIDLNDWVKTGEGSVGESFFHKNDPSLMLKMNFIEAPADSWITEITNSEAAHKLGLPVPKPGSIVFDGKRYGLMFQRIPDKVSYARAVGDHPENIPALAKDFAQVVRTLHTTVCKVDDVRDIKEYNRENILKSRFHDEAFKAKALKLVDSLPDGDTGVHGDLHFGNMIIGGGKTYIIDMDHFCYGYYKFDLAMFFVIIRMKDFAPEEYFKSIYHCTYDQAKQFLQCYMDDYFGKSVDLAALEEELAPYIALRIISAENDIDTPYPDIPGFKACRYIDNL